MYDNIRDLGIAELRQYRAQRDNIVKRFKNKEIDNDSYQIMSTRVKAKIQALEDLFRKASACGIKVK